MKLTSMWTAGLGFISLTSVNGLVIPRSTNIVNTADSTPWALFRPDFNITGKSWTFLKETPQFHNMLSEASYSDPRAQALWPNKSESSSQPGNNTSTFLASSTEPTKNLSKRQETIAYPSETIIQGSDFTIIQDPLETRIFLPGTSIVIDPAQTLVNGVTVSTLPTPLPTIITTTQVPSTSTVPLTSTAPPTPTSSLTATSTSSLITTPPSSTPSPLPPPAIPPQKDAIDAGFDELMAQIFGVAASVIIPQLVAIYASTIPNADTRQREREAWIAGGKLLGDFAQLVLLGRQSGVVLSTLIILAGRSSALGKMLPAIFGAYGLANTANIATQVITGRTNARVNIPFAILTKIVSPLLGAGIAKLTSYIRNSPQEFENFCRISMGNADIELLGRIGLRSISQWDNYLANQVHRIGRYTDLSGFLIRVPELTRSSSESTELAERTPPGETRLTAGGLQLPSSALITSPKIPDVEPKTSVFSEGFPPGGVGGMTSHGDSTSLNPRQSTSNPVYNSKTARSGFIEKIDDDKSIHFAKDSESENDNDEQLIADLPETLREAAAEITTKLGSIPTQFPTLLAWRDSEVIAIQQILQNQETLISQTLAALEPESGPPIQKHRRIAEFMQEHFAYHETWMVPTLEILRVREATHQGTAIQPLETQSVQLLQTTSIMQQIDQLLRRLYVVELQEDINFALNDFRTLTDKTSNLRQNLGQQANNDWNRELTECKEELGRLGGLIEQGQQKEPENNAHLLALENQVQRNLLQLQNEVLQLGTERLLTSITSQSEIISAQVAFRSNILEEDSSEWQTELDKMTEFSVVFDPLQNLNGITAREQPVELLIERLREIAKHPSEGAAENLKTPVLEQLQQLGATANETAAIWATIKLDRLAYIKLENQYDDDDMPPAIPVRETALITELIQQAGIPDINRTHVERLYQQFGVANGGTEDDPIIVSVSMLPQSLDDLRELQKLLGNPLPQFIAKDPLQEKQTVRINPETDIVTGIKMGDELSSEDEQSSISERPSLEDGEAPIEEEHSDIEASSAIGITPSVRTTASRLSIMNQTTGLLDGSYKRTEENQTYTGDERQDKNQQWDQPDWYGPYVPSDDLETTPLDLPKPINQASPEEEAPPELAAPVYKSVSISEWKKPAVNITANDTVPSIKQPGDTQGKSFNYNHQFIILMQGDAECHQAAIDLFNKHPHESTLIYWNPNMENGNYQVMAGPERKMDSESRILFVGHGLNKAQDLSKPAETIADQTPQELARKTKVLLEEHLGNVAPKQISFSACNTAAKMNTANEHSKSYAGQYTQEIYRIFMESGIQISTKISGIDTGVSISEGGHKKVAKGTQHVDEHKVRHSIEHDSLKTERIFKKCVVREIDEIGNSVTVSFPEKGENREFIADKIIKVTSEQLKQLKKGAIVSLSLTTPDDKWQIDSVVKKSNRRG